MIKIKKPLDFERFFYYICIVKHKYFFLSILFSLNSYSQNRIIVRGLNDFEKSDLPFVANIIKSNFGIPIYYQTSIKVSKTDRIQTNDVQKLIKSKTSFGYDSDKDITVFVTRDKLRTEDLDVAGICYGNQVYIQVKKSKKYITNTLIHEISHSFGLKHCSNKCLMSIDKKNYEITSFCNDCRKKLPKYFKK